MAYILGSNNDQKIILYYSSTQTLLRETNLKAPWPHLNKVQILLFVKLIQVTYFILYKGCILAINDP